MGFLRRSGVGSPRRLSSPERLRGDRINFGSDRAGVVWLHGAPVTVRRITATRASARLHNGNLLVSGPDDRSSDTVLRWYRREAGRRITAAAARDAIALGVEFHSLAIRDQRTRWGSCSRRGNLSFSWRLVAAPRAVLDYVVVHELCHLREPNHSKAFYRLLDTVRPIADDARWLAHMAPNCRPRAESGESITESGCPHPRWARARRLGGEPRPVRPPGPPPGTSAWKHFEPAPPFTAAPGATRLARRRPVTGLLPGKTRSPRPIVSANAGHYAR